MLKLGHIEDLALVAHLPIEVQNVLEENLNTLDSEYGKERDIDGDLGGYILVAETEVDVAMMAVELGVDLEDAIPEFLNVIEIAGAESYTHTMLMANSDFVMMLVIPYGLTPKVLLDYSL